MSTNICQSVETSVSAVSHCLYLHADLPQKYFPCGVPMVLPPRSYSGTPPEQPTQVPTAETLNNV